MAKVWFVRRHGGQWIAPGGAPAFELPLDDVLFPLDMGTHRRLDDVRPRPVADIPVESPESLSRVMVELDAEDIKSWELSGYAAGIYDSGLSPSAAARRLESLRR